MKPVGVIMARGGSKGLPGKHLETVNGRPVIAHAVRYARDALQHVYVSTDCPAIAAAADKAGASIIHRPAELAQDDSDVLDALWHAAGHFRDFDLLVNLEGATIILRPGLIDDCIARLVSTGAERVGTVVRAHDHHPDWAVSMDSDGRLHMDTPHVPCRQQLRPLWHLQESVQVWKRSTVAAPRATGWTHRSLDTVGFEISQHDLVHIDTAADLRLATLLSGPPYLMK